MLINGISSDMIFGYVLHALMLYYLYTGVTAAKKLKTLPADPVEVFDVEPVAGEPVEE